jgi:hypothetical protein
MPPLHQRTEKLLKDKITKLENERNTKKMAEEKILAKECTFQPKSSRNGRSRSPESLTKELYKWNENKNKNLERQRKEKDLREISQIIDKPKLGSLTNKITKEVRII